jgi:hypothetical protein
MKKNNKTMQNKKILTEKWNGKSGSSNYNVLMLFQTAEWLTRLNLPHTILTLVNKVSPLRNHQLAIT